MGTDCDNVKRVTTFSHGSWFMPTIASRVLVGAGPVGGVVAANSWAHCACAAMHAATMLPIELRVATDEGTFGGLASTDPIAPLTGSTRLSTIPAAFSRPGEGPLS